MLNNPLEEDNFAEKKIMLNPETRQNDIEKGSDKNTESSDNNRGIFDFLSNPKEAIAKEIITKVNSQSKSWFDYFKCNFE